MVNDLRVLLFNEAASGRPGVGEFGEEYIPDDYVPVTTGFEGLRKALFSESADPLFQNYRLSQYMEILKNSPREVLQYLNPDRRVLIVNAIEDITWGKTLTRDGSTPDEFTIDLIGYEPIATRRCYWSWDIVYAGSDTVTVTMTDGPSVDLTMNFTNGQSDILTLPGQQTLQFRVRYPGALPTPATPWKLTQTITLRPEQNVAEVFADIENAPSLYRNLFKLPQELGLVQLWGGALFFNQAAALLAALIQRTRESLPS